MIESFAEKSNWALIKSLSEVCDRVEKFQENLRSVGLFMRKHKFFEIDWRREKDKVSNEKLSDSEYSDLIRYNPGLHDYINNMFRGFYEPLTSVSTFSYKFPEPQLVEEHYELSAHCKISSKRCIEAVKEAIE